MGPCRHFSGGGGEGVGETQGRAGVHELGGVQVVQEVLDRPVRTRVGQGVYPDPMPLSFSDPDMLY